VDTSETQELLTGYLGELDWTDGVTKDRLLAHLAGRADTLRTMLNEYVTEGTCHDMDAVLSVIPAQAWQDSQGDQWQGAAMQYVADVPSHFRERAVGQDRSDAYRSGGLAPATPGFGQSAGATEGAPSDSTGS
jgi:hypothetical protein